MLCPLLFPSEVIPVLGQAGLARHRFIKLLYRDRGYIAGYLRHGLCGGAGEHIHPAVCRGRIAVGGIRRLAEQAVIGKCARKQPALLQQRHYCHEIFPWAAACDPFCFLCEKAVYRLQPPHIHFEFIAVKTGIQNVKVPSSVVHFNHPFCLLRLSVCSPWSQALLCWLWGQSSRYRPHPQLSPPRAARFSVPPRW